MSAVTRPPAYVPTLTEIVHPDSAREPLNKSVIAEKTATQERQALMVQRVLLHIDGVLEKRLHEAAEKLIREHAKAILPPLLDEIERIVRESVCQALEHEMPTIPMQSDSQEPHRF